MYNLIVIALLSFASLTFSFKISPHKAPGHHIHAWNFKAKSHAPSHLKNAMNGTIELKFETSQYMFELDLKLFEHLYGPDAKIIGWDKDGNEIEYEKRHRSYHGNVIISTINNNNNNNDINIDTIDGTASVTFYEDNRFHAVIVTNDEVFTIDLKELHLRDQYAGSLLGNDNGHGMVMIRQSDVIGKNKDGLKNKIESIAQKNRKLLASTASTTVFYNCYTGQFEYVRAMSVGIVTDTSFWKVYNYNNSLTLSAVEAIFSDTAANTIYYKQLNIRLTLGTTYIGSNAASLSISSYSSSYDINSRLDAFTTWRKSYYTSNPTESNGIWHLLTNNHAPPGTVGLAWVGVLCSYASGTGISNYINPATSYYGTGTWETFAHEVGHNFGAGHAFQDGQGVTGGIMDYGDGQYPVGSGIYQFHPTYNQKEVCTEITESMTDSTTRRYYNLLNVTKCWYQYSRTTQSPTTPKPTAKPTPAPTLAPGKTAAPTTPKPTSKPTAKPTSKVTTPAPTTSTVSGGTYVWYETGQYSECWPDCGSNSYKTAVLGCFQVTRSYYYYYYSQVDDSQCDVVEKPTATQVSCQLGYDVPSCDPLCGDGFVSKGELCDTATAIGSCCNSDCQSYKETLECWSVNPVIDAAFQDTLGRVYLFQGPFYARYSNYVYGASTNTPDSGFPKTIAGSFPISSWTEDIGAIAYKSDSEIWVFKGLQYTKIDLNTGELAGYPKYFTTDYTVPAGITSCGSIDGAVALSNTMVVFCDDIYGYVTYDKRYTTSTEVRSISDFGKISETVNAVYNKPGYSTIYIFSTQQVTTTASSLVAQSQSIFVNSNITDLNQVYNQSCYDENCIDCLTSNTKYCSKCRSNYTLYGNYKCLTESIIMYLDMDNSSNSIDHYFAQDLTDMIYVDSATGIYHTGILFNGTTKLALKPLNLSEENALEEITVSVRFYPYSIMEDILITIDESIYVILVNVSETNVTRIEFTVGNNTFLSLTDNPIILNDWNTIEVSYIDDTFSVDINGDEQIQAYSDWSGIDVKLYFSDWYLGSDTNGINGILDEVIVSKTSNTAFYNDNGSPNQSKDDDVTSKTWFIIVITVLSFVIIAAFCIGGFCWRKKSREVDNVNNHTYGYQKM